MFPNSISSKEELDRFIVGWNNKFPLDYWWRKKHNLAFNSPQHRSACPIDIYIESREEELIKSALSKDSKSDEKLYEGNGDFLRPRSKFKEKLDQSEIEEDFEKMEI